MIADVAPLLCMILPLYVYAIVGLYGEMKLAGLSLVSWLAGAQSARGSRSKR